METIEYNGNTYYSLEECEECGEFGKNYYVSKDGNILSTKYGKFKILKSGKSNNGYLVIVLCQNGKAKSIKVHRIVASVFLNNNKPIPKGMHIDHKNRIKDDNRMDNLRIVTPLQNAHNTEKYITKTMYEYMHDIKTLLLLLFSISNSEKVKTITKCNKEINTKFNELNKTITEIVDMLKN